MSGPPVSALIVGWTRHRRHRHPQRTFRHRTYHALIDLDELPRLDRDVRGFSSRRAAPLQLRARDHLERGDAPLKAKLARTLAARGHALPDGQVLLLANLRVAGQVFDPVSWWFCHRSDGTLALVVAEVHNTFGDAEAYVLDELEHHPGGQVTAEAAKHLHVSPYLPIDGLRYRFRFALRSEHVVAHVEVHDDDGLVLDATQTGRPHPMDTATLWRTVLANPLLPLRTVIAIHAHAVVLAIRGARFHRRPAPPVDGIARWRRRVAAAEEPEHPRAHQPSASPDRSAQPR